MFWKISRIYFFFFSIENIDSNCYIIFLNFFQSSILFFVISSWFNATVDGIFCHIFIFIVMFFIDGIYCCFFLFFFHSVRRIYIWSSTIRIYFMTFIEWTNLKTKVLPCILSKYPFTSESKSYFITSSASSLIMIFILSLF